jgi:hypothetical protein
VRVPRRHPRPLGRAADSRLLTGRLRRLAESAGAEDPTETADGLLAFYDGALARLARQATTEGLDTGDPVHRARWLAAGWLTGQVLRVRPSG